MSARLHRLVSVDPREAESEARFALDDHGGTDPEEAAALQWVLGLALRELGRLGEARIELEAAYEAAQQFGFEQLGARAASSLAFVIGQLGDLDQAMELMRATEHALTGIERARALGQFGVILCWRGDWAEASERLAASADELTAWGDEVMATRYRSNLGAVRSLMGDYDGAEQHLRIASATAERLGLYLDAGTAGANLGYVATLRGDLPAAIEEFERAERHYRAGNVESYLPRLHADHAQALADAGLFDDADGLIQLAVQTYRDQGQRTELAGALLTSAEIRLAQRDVDGAVDAAKDARERFATQGRPSWELLATALELQARARLDHRDDDLAPRLDSVAEGLAESRLPSESTRCRLVAHQVRAAGGSSASIDRGLRAAAERARASDQILLAHVDALAAVNRADRPGARRAVTRGLAVVMSNQATLGSIETRAHAAVHGAALTILGARLAVDDGRPRELLERIEASRLMSSRTPDVRPPDDDHMAAMLTELRSHNASIADPTSTEEQRADAQRARTRIERDIRRRSRQMRGDAASVGVRDELGAAVSMLGDRHLLAHAALDGRLYAVSVVKGKARLHDLGDIEGVTGMLDEVAFSLNRLNRVQGSEASRLAAAEMLFEISAELSELLLPPIVGGATEPVVIVPTAVLHDVPWGLLPPLGGRAVSINPSVSAWARAERTRLQRATERTGLRSVGFMAGPGLDFAEFEVENLSKLYIEPEVYVGGAATSEACVDLLRRADVVHIACHGSFRTDNPMFSSLHLADGPVIVHDLERLHRLPETVILPACSVGTTKALQGGSLLGLASALTTLGACNVIAPLTPINDAASVTVMDRLHHELIAGASPAAALAVAALEHDLTDPTAGAFITLGA